MARKKKETTEAVIVINEDISEPNIKKAYFVILVRVSYIIASNDSTGNIILREDKLNGKKYKVGDIICLE